MHNGQALAKVARCTLHDAGSLAGFLSYTADGGGWGGRMIIRKCN